MIGPATVDDVLEQAATKAYTEVLIVGLTADGDVVFHASTWPEDAYQLARIAVAYLDMLMTPETEMAQA